MILIYAFKNPLNQIISLFVVYAIQWIYLAIFRPLLKSFDMLMILLI